MKAFKYPVFLVHFLLLSGMASAFGSQARVAPIKDFLDEAALVVVVDVKKVTAVEVSTGSDQTTIIYVAEAEVFQTLKSDRTPTPKKRKIAIVGSTIPMSKAVWRPIERGRYLAFLSPEQGHYRFSARNAMRPISPKGKVEWHEKNAKGDYKFFELNIEEAIKKIRSEQGKEG